MVVVGRGGGGWQRWRWLAEVVVVVVLVVVEAVVNISSGGSYVTVSFSTCTQSVEDWIVADLH